MNGLLGLIVRGLSRFAIGLLGSYVDIYTGDTRFDLLCESVEARYMDLIRSQTIACIK